MLGVFNEHRFILYMPGDYEEAGMAHLKTIARGAGIVFAGVMLSKLFSYLYRMFIARYFGPSDYGLISLGISVAGLFSIFALLGLSSGVTRYISFYLARKDREGVRGVVMSSLGIVLVCSLALAAVMAAYSEFIAVSFFHEQQLSQVLAVMAASLPFTAMVTVICAIFLGFQRIGYRVYTENIFQNFARLLFMVPFGIVGGTVLGLAWAWTVAMAATFAFSLLLLHRTFPVFSRGRSKPVKAEMLSYSLPLLLAGFMGTLVMWTDTIMLGYYMTPADVGIYNAALPTAQLLIILPGALTALFLPIMTELHAGKKALEMRKVLKTVTRWLFYLNFPIFLLLLLFSRQALNILFGPEYIPGYRALMVLSVGFLASNSIPSTAVLQMMKRTRSIMYVTIATAGTSVALNFLLIPVPGEWGGIMGAGIATMTTYVLNFVLMLLFAYRYTRISPFSGGMWKSVAAGLVAAAATYVAAVSLFESMPVYVLFGFFMVFAAIYGSVLLALRSFSKEDIEIMRSMEARTGIRFRFLAKLLRRFS